MFAQRNRNEEVVPRVPYTKNEILNLRIVQFSYSTSQQMSWSETVLKMTYAYRTLQLFSIASSSQTTECIEIKLSSEMLDITPGCA